MEYLSEIQRKKAKRTMKQKRINNFSVLLIISLIILNMSVVVAQTSTAPKVNETLTNVPPAKVIWQKIFGGTADDRAFNTVPTKDGYLVVGSTKSVVSNTIVGWALMLDKSGNEVWNKTFLEGSGTELRFAANLTDGFLLVGNEFLSSGNVDGFVAKIDSQGVLLWKTTIGGENVDKLFSAIATEDGFLLLGSSSYNANGDSHAWIVKIGLNGSLSWSKTYGNATDTIARIAVLAPDSYFMVAGYTDPRAENSYDFLLMKIDAKGNLVWNNTYGGTGTQEVHSMANAPDGYVIVGDTQSQNNDIHAWIIKVDFNGTMQWATTVGGKNADSPSYITAAKDGGYLVAGFTFSFGSGNRDFWLFKINDSGKVLWSCTQGDAGYQEAYNVIETINNQYVMTGWTDPPGQPSLIGKAQYDFYIAEIDVPKNHPGLSSFQIIACAVIAFVGLTALFALLKFRKKNKGSKAK
jgi:hypothetical protein